MTRATATTDIRWPAEHFFMARLDLSKVPRGMRLNDEALRFLFEAELPLPLSEVHAVFVRQKSGQVLAIGCEKARLREVRDASEAASLGPDSIPEWLAADVDPESINVLVDEFLPNSVRAMRRSIIGEGLLAAAIAVAMLLIGLERRTRADQEHADALRAQQLSVLAQVLGPDGGRTSSGQRRLALTGELRRQRQAHRVEPTNPTHDVAFTLADVLHRWPIEFWLRSLNVSEDTIAITATAGSATQAEDAARQFSTMPPFELASPQVAAEKSGVAVTLRLSRSKAETK